MKKQEDLVSVVLQDFKKRQNERKQFEATWKLCMNFLMGNQYCSIAPNLEVENNDKQYFWQEREVYNHIAPTLDIRLAKLQKVRPIMSVVPASNDDCDLKTAKLCKKIINSVYNKQELSAQICKATKWSEICGTSFYKIIWNSELGDVIAKDNKNILRTGDIEVSVLSPFEIYPDSVNNENIDDCQSIIHAKAYHIDEIKRIYNVDVKGEDINVFSLENVGTGLGGLGYNSYATKIVSGIKSNHALVIEKYEKPSKDYPNGRFIIIAGNTLVYNGELPFVNRIDGTRGFPFIKQVSIEQAGSFWGTGIVERLIPVQRAYNAVKNRKHEFLNRISMGVLTVEDGSVDLDNLEEEGLSPGKILVYRQGSNAPRFMSANSVPTDFEREEQALLAEFMTISGVSDILNSSSTYTNLSGVALQLLIEQDESRISPTSDKIKECTKELGGQILRLYKQFATVPRLLKVAGDNGELELEYFNASDITSEDIVFESDSEISESLAQRRSMVFDLLNAGLLADENGKLSNRMRLKALDLLGFGIWENAQDLNELHTKKASAENVDLANQKDVKVCEIDNHDLHIQEHISYMLGCDYKKRLSKNKNIEKVFLEHIRKHKQMKKMEESLKQEEQ